MPLVIAARPMVASPADARRSGKPIIYIQGNIHAGEVEGKEAAQAVLRRICQEGPGGLLDKVILLFDPIYNIDGNERFGPQERNRPEQNGPAQVGVRTSSEGFDLNRDGMKAESIEFRAVLDRIWNRWDPDVMMDLHTTDGTRHGYDLTYAPPLNPNTDPGILRFSRDEMLPAIRRQFHRQFATELFDYGDDTTNNKIRGWRTFGEGGRYMTNYAGIRNRIGILSEAATYIPFKDRVVATDRFVTSVLDYVAKNSRRVLDLTRHADMAVAELPKEKGELGVRFEMAVGRTEEALIEPEPGPGQKRPYTGRPAKLDRIKMPIYERFKATRTARVPSGYLIPAGETRILELLRRHGVVVERFLSPATLAAQRFDIAKVNVESRAFQGHRLALIDGAFQPVTEIASAGSYLVRMSQPLGILIFNLLEPESSDGVVTWNFLSQDPAPGSRYPILKVFGAIPAVTERVP